MSKLLSMVWYVSMVLEQIALAAVFYFGQVFVFCRLINKNVLEWLLLKKTKKIWLRRRGRSIFIKTQFLKFLQYSRENTYEKFLRTTILKNICVPLLLNWFYEVIVWNFVSGSHLIPFWLSNITKISIAFKSKL